jgi:hypothetical protein
MRKSLLTLPLIILCTICNGNGWDDVVWASAATKATNLVASPSGKYIASDGQVWNAATRRLEYLRMPRYSIEAWAVSDSGLSYLTIGTGNAGNFTLEAADVNFGIMRWSIPVSNEVVLAATDSEVICKRSNTLYFRSPSDGAVVRTLSLSDVPSYMASNGDFVAYVDSNPMQCRVFDHFTGALKRTIVMSSWVENLRRSLSGLHFTWSDNGGSGGNGRLFLIDIVSGSRVTGPLASSSTVSYNGGEIYVPAVGGIINVYDANWQLLRTIPGGTGKLLAVLPDNRTIWSELTFKDDTDFGRDGTISRLLDGTDGAPLPLFGLGSYSFTPAFSGDDQSLIFAGTVMAKLSRADGAFEWSTPPRDPYPMQIALTEQGKRVAVVTAFHHQARSLQIYDAATGALLSTSTLTGVGWQIPFRQVLHGAWETPYCVFALDRTNDTELMVYNTSTGQRIRSLIVDARGPVQLNADGTSLYFMRGSTGFQIYSFPDLVLQKSLAGKVIGFSPDGLQYAWMLPGNAGERIEIRKTSDDARLFELVLPARALVSEAHWDPDGSVIFVPTGGLSGSVSALYAFDASNGALRGTVGPSLNSTTMTLSRDAHSIAVPGFLGQVVMMRNPYHGDDAGRTKAWRLISGESPSGYQTDLMYRDSRYVTLNRAPGPSASTWSVVLQCSTNAPLTFGDAATLELTFEPSSAVDLVAVSAFDWQADRYVAIGFCDIVGGKGSLEIEDLPRFVRPGDSSIKYLLGMRASLSPGNVRMDESRILF